jgi:hypothetical protein
MTHKSDPAAYSRRLNDALAEAGEARLECIEAYDLYRSRHRCEDALILLGTVAGSGMEIIVRGGRH